MKNIGIVFSEQLFFLPCIFSLTTELQGDKTPPRKKPNGLSGENWAV
jgi:hypothetical protein